MNTLSADSTFALEARNGARRHARRSIDAPVVLKASEVTLRGHALNVSEGGLRVLFATDALRIAARVLGSTRLSVFVDSDNARAVRIAWYRFFAGGAVVGLAFEA